MPFSEIRNKEEGQILEEKYKFNYQHIEIKGFVLEIILCNYVIFLCGVCFSYLLQFNISKMQLQTLTVAIYHVTALKY